MTKPLTLVDVSDGKNLGILAAQAVVQNPKEKYNPLFYVTHYSDKDLTLLKVIKNTILAQHGYKYKVLHIEAKDFAKEYIYKNLETTDILLLEDIELLNLSYETQDILVKTFKEKQVIITANKRVKELDNLSTKFKQYLENGLMYEDKIRR